MPSSPPEPAASLLPRAILFDLDDTLITSTLAPRDGWSRALGAHLAASHGLDITEAAKAIVETARHYWSDPERHRIGRKDIAGTRRRFVRTALSPHGIEDDLAHAVADAFGVLRHETTELYPDAVSTLDGLRNAGVRLALVTNGTSEAQRAKIERFALARHFDHIQIEGEFGLGKPEPAVYHNAMDRLGVGPSDTWMIGDNLEWEVATPQRLGITGIWRDPVGRGLPDGTKIVPDRVVTRLAELLEA